MRLENYSATFINWEIVVSIVSYKQTGFTGLTGQNHWYGPLNKEIMSGKTGEHVTEGIALAKHIEFIGFYSTCNRI